MTRRHKAFVCPRSFFRVGKRIKTVYLALRFFSLSIHLTHYNAESRFLLKRFFKRISPISVVMVWPWCRWDSCRLPRQFSNKMHFRSFSLIFPSKEALSNKPSCFFLLQWQRRHWRLVGKKSFPFMHCLRVDEKQKKPEENSLPNSFIHFLCVQATNGKKFQAENSAIIVVGN